MTNVQVSFISSVPSKVSLCRVRPSCVVTRTHPVRHCSRHLKLTDKPAHGAFGALAFGIGTSEVEHVLATQTLPQAKSKNMRINVEGTLIEGVTSKDIVLHIIGLIGTAGGTGCVIEFAGSAIRSLSMEARM